MLKKIIQLVTCISLGLLAACSSQKPEPKNVVTVGTVAGPETQLMEVAKQVAKKRYGLDVQIIPFSDYNAPNLALVSGSIDANAFQHQAFLKAQVKARGFKIMALGKTFLYPMGIYSQKIKQLADVKSGDKVAVPNDPSNEARALLLLQQAQLIKLRAGVGVQTTPVDITANPKHLKFVELDAAQLPRSLPDVTLAVINTTYAAEAHLSPMRDALLHESIDSPYANLIVVRTADKGQLKLKQLVQAYQSPAVKAKAKQLFGDAAIAAW
jgi:D-methionine transport system substrate-binding protein